ncbi:APC family permease [Alienimonas sp. DA493]|uniref:APC family permease n=1 Tax=Alienimonas sp. DA493 TaxID=3373605 RepID=UPI0037545646
MNDSTSTATQYESSSLSLVGSVGMGTGVMIGAGVFALTGQTAEQTGSLFPLAFLSAGVVAAFSAYSYVKMAQRYPSVGGIAMFLMKAYGKGTVTAGMALLMYASMVINESLVARTFGTYVLQLFGDVDRAFLVPALGTGLLVTAFAVNLLGNRFIGTLSTVAAVVKIGGILLFAAAGLWVAELSVETAAPTARASPGGFLTATALALLAYKGFTTIANSGAEIVDPKRNIGRSIVISLSICVVVYLLVAAAVAGNLSVAEIIESRDFALAEAARPAFGQFGTSFTVGLAVVATVSGLVASTFAVSRMLAMLTEMKLVPHRHFGMPGSVQKHTLVYTVVLAITLTILFDLTRIAALGAIFYLVMDLAVHWGVLRRLRQEVGARAWIVGTAILLDLAILGAFLWTRAIEDPLVLGVAAVGIAVVFLGERMFLGRATDGGGNLGDSRPAAPAPGRGDH